MSAQPGAQPVPWLPPVKAHGCAQPFTLYNMGDIHIGAADFLQDQWEADLARIKDEPNAALVINGDLFQADSRTGKHGAVYGQTMDLNQALDYAVTVLTPLRDKIALISSGNHDERVYHSVGLDLVAQLAARLGLANRYARDGAILPLEIGAAPDSNDRHGKPRPLLYLVYVYHGDRNGQSRPSLERAANAFPGCDAYLSGHTHDPNCFTVTFLEPNRQTRTTTLRAARCLTAGAYQTGYAGYARRANLRPRGLGMTRLILRHDQRLVEGVI